MWVSIDNKVMVTESPEMLRVLEIARNLANTKSTVLIHGESGTGKELVARWVHHHSARQKRAFVALNCAALPEGLLESELFGFERGAFTGAVQQQKGKFELAHGGTFLLDEISELPLLLQGKLLRVIQEGEVTRLGGQKPLSVDVRLLATTNRDLKNMVKEGTFREDLYYRLNVLPIRTLPLRERPQDIPLLAQFFMERTCNDNELGAKKWTSEALERLNNYDWPGNVREMENVVQRSVLLCQGPSIRPDDVLLDSEAGVVRPSFRVGMSLRQMERVLIFKTLEMTGNNRSQAAHILGITVRTLRNKLADYRDEVSA